MYVVYGVCVKMSVRACVCMYVMWCLSVCYVCDVCYVWNACNVCMCGVRVCMYVVYVCR